MYQIVERLNNQSSSRGLLLAIKLRMYLLSGCTPMRLVSHSVDVVEKYNQIKALLIEPKGGA